jgi:ribosomal protein L37AE/L43A
MTYEIITKDNDVGAPFCPICNSCNVHKSKRMKSWSCYKCGAIFTRPLLRIKKRINIIPKYLRNKVISKTESEGYKPKVSECYKKRCKHLACVQTLHGDATKYKTTCDKVNLPPHVLTKCPLDDNKGA